MNIYLQGLMMGLAYVAPIGVQNLFVIDSAITQSRKRAYITALIVIFFDISLALACFLGIGALMEAIPLLQKVILSVGAVIVIWIGVSLVRSEGKLDTSEDMSKPLAKIAMSAFAVAWLNPQALIDGTMMLGAMKATLPPGTDMYFILGFISASALWFLSVTTAISVFKGHFNDKVLTWINRICGVIIIFYGIKLIVSFVKMVVPGLS
jgi:L-lysine exporter family protein LysE/ArgO